MRVEVMCPAASKQCRCPFVEDSMALSPAEVPTVVSQPNAADLPYVCRQTFSPVVMDTKQFKQYGVHLFGSAAHQRLYKDGCALNEQWHSQLRADHTGGIDGSVFKTLGVERIGLITALAVVKPIKQCSALFVTSMNRPSCKPMLPEISRDERRPRRTVGGAVSCSRIIPEKMVEVSPGWAPVISTDGAIERARVKADGLSSLTGPLANTTRWGPACPKKS